MKAIGNEYQTLILYPEGNLLLTGTFVLDDFKSTWFKREGDRYRPKFTKDNETIIKMSIGLKHVCFVTGIHVKLLLI